MPTLRIDPSLEMFYQVDNFTHPWTKPETVLLMHGNSESGDAWYAWVPRLAGDFQVLRPDMRGYGRSTAMPRDFKWSLDVISDDFIRLLDELKLERVHVVGAKIGGTLARAFVARHPQRVKTLSVVGSPGATRKNPEQKIAEMMALFENHSIEHWARITMDNRLGSRFPAEAKEWWAKFMGRTDLSSQLGFIPAISHADLRADIARIRCPTLAITTDQGHVASVEEVREWLEKVPGSELVVLKNDSYHPAVTNADECAAAVRAFILKHSAP
jgi:pimeloyl-ACP methyl ester carboxylesterase